ncbi:hypothetical protein O2K51_12985 [Apibacter raozihei]|uniref:hypothetical protein n=1 Tax=Apibacter raozihei TaxID=2500547 RepID=UPI000FE2F5B8|nr:hypothetical protein [Apibacter raozihei]
MKIIIVGIIANLIPLLSFCFQIIEDSTILAYTFIVVISLFWILSVIGAMILPKKRKAGAIMVIIGSFIYIPIGFIAIIGARKLLDKKKLTDLEERRKISRNLSQKS